MRTSGLLLHLTSLPGPEGVGTMGAEAIRFLDALQRAGQSLWQILPIHPTIVGDSPFQGPSVFAGNPNLIDLAALVEAGDLDASEYRQYLAEWRTYRRAHPGRSDGWIEYGFLWEHKVGFDSRLDGYEGAPLRRAHARFAESADERRRRAFDDFCARSAHWLDDYALFMALKDAYGYDVQWYRWEPFDARRVEGFERGVDSDAVEFFKYVQFVFDEQMGALHAAARQRGIALVGDLAIYAGYDSADVWSNQGLFQLDDEGCPTRVAAVPPDYFSALGQLWGNPLYRWGDRGAPADHERIYAWWARRMARELEYFDTVKIDHFRGFESYGAVDASSQSAIDAAWVPGPGREAFDRMTAILGRELPLIAEDLGIITDAVRQLLKDLGLPGMKVFMFADWQTGDPRKNDTHPYLPHNVNATPHCVYYTGTHDNETLRQKIEVGMTDVERANLKRYVAGSVECDLGWKILDSISATTAEYVVFPVQDVLYLGAEARMNNPAERDGCWRWRLSEAGAASLAGAAGDRLAKLAARTGRAAGPVA